MNVSEEPELVGALGAALLASPPGKRDDRQKPIIGEEAREA